jgi:hypothetical protein
VLVASLILCSVSDVAGGADAKADHKRDRKGDAKPADLQQGPFREAGALVLFWPTLIVCCFRSSEAILSRQPLPV